MCGRYVRKGEPKKVAEFLGVKDGEENWTQSFNVAPSATTMFCRMMTLERRLRASVNL